MYRGIEGMHWPDNTPEKFKILHGLAALEQLPQIMNYYRSLYGDRNCDLLYIQTHEVPTIPNPPPSGFTFCGYDFGNYISEYNFFSVIFNEVLLGKYEEMRQFASYLNENLLFEKETDVEKLKVIREKLTQQGADLETTEIDEGFCEIKVYIFSEAKNI